jgi:hypothetical protein
VARLLKRSVVTVLFCASSVMCFAQAGPKNRILREIDSSQMTRLHGNVSPRLQMGTDQGRLNGAMKLKGASLIFGPSASQKAALQTLLAQQQDRTSPNYHKWLTPEEYADRFSMSQSDIDKVTAWLKSQGFTIDGVSRSRNRVSFSGTVAQIESVFQTEFHQYLVDGEEQFANATELSVPAALSSSALGFRNLNDLRLKPRVRKFNPNFTSSMSGNTFLAPADIATIYNLNGLYNAGFDGTGQTIAVVGQTAIKLSDISNFRSAAGLPAKAPQLLLVPGGVSTIVVADEVEADLDIEWSGAVAKNATIIYVYTDQSNAQGGVIGAWDYAIQNDVAPIISISYGTCETGVTASDITFLQTDAQQANLQGQTVVSAVGDIGATDCEARTARIATHGLSVDLPGALQEVTGIGGTTFTGDDNHNPTFWAPSNDPLTGGSALQYIQETTWNDGFGSSTGGGVSTVITKPSWQAPPLTPADGHRDVPDVSLSASPNHDPYLVCGADQSGGTCVNGFRDASNNLLAVGGTSVGAPEFAGMIALINQATENSAGSGNVNPTLYSLAASTPAAFHDIKTGNNKQLCQGGSTGCTSANSHVQIANQKSSFPAYAGLMLVPFCAVFISLGRQRWVTALGMVLLVAVFSLQIACGGGSNNNNNTPPPNVSIGWSAGTGYDLVTGLGSVDASTLASAWPFYTTSPAFNLSAAPTTITTTVGTQGSSTITLTRTNSSFSDNVNLTCIAIPLNATCTVNPTLVTLNGSSTTGTTTVKVSAPTAGTYLVSVTAMGGTTFIAHSITIPVTVN